MPAKKFPVMGTGLSKTHSYSPLLFIAVVYIELRLTVLPPITLPGTPLLSAHTVKATLPLMPSRAPNVTLIFSMLPLPVWVK